MDKASRDECLSILDEIRKSREEAEAEGWVTASTWQEAIEQVAKATSEHNQRLGMLEGIVRRIILG